MRDVRFLGIGLLGLLLAACGGGDVGGQTGPGATLRSLVYTDIIEDQGGVQLHLRDDGKGIARKVVTISVPSGTELASLDLYGILVGDKDVIPEGESEAKAIEKRIPFTVEQAEWDALAGEADKYGLLETPDSRQLEEERRASGAGRRTVQPGTPQAMAARLRLSFSDGTEKVWTENDIDQYPGVQVFFRSVATLAAGNAERPPEPDQVLPYEEDFNPPGY